MSAFTSRLRAIAARENCDYPPYDALQEAAAVIDGMEKDKAELLSLRVMQRTALANLQDMYQQLEKDKAGLAEAEKRYAAAFVRIAQAHGITSPMQLIGRAVDDNENYAEILARVIESKMDSIKQHGGAHE
jgi:hypothetical protein